MYQFKFAKQPDPEEEKRRYVKSVLKEKFSSEMLSNATDFINKVVMKMSIRGINLNIFFIAYMCYDNLGFSLVCDQMIHQGLKIPHPGFVKTTINWLEDRPEVVSWFKYFANKKLYTLDKYYFDIAYYIIHVVQKIDSSTKNYDLTVEEEESSNASGEEEEEEFLL